MALKELAGARLRANPRYRLVALAQLPPAQHAALGELPRSADFYGVLMPESPGLTMKAVCRQTAELFASLAEPAPLPACVRDQDLAELILDEILEIAAGDRFCSGSAAYATIFRDQPAADGAGALAQLSHAALRYGAQLQIEDAGRLAARIYFYNRLPVNASLLERWPDHRAVLADMELQPHGALGRRLQREYALAEPDEEYRGWLTWTLRERQARDRATQMTYKAYVSPRPKHARAAVSATVESALETGASCFKIGCDAFGFARPDKIVVYFADQDELRTFAAALEPRLAGCPAHGIPFTAELTTDGLLSWGADPPHRGARLPWGQTESWRLWLANRAAVALLATREGDGGDVDPVRFAIERLRLAGVDTATWTPDLETWSALR